MKYGFVKAACATPQIRVADCTFNAQSILECVQQADASGAHKGIIVFNLLFRGLWKKAGVNLHTSLSPNIQQRRYKLLIAVVSQHHHTHIIVLLQAAENPRANAEQAAVFFRIQQWLQGLLKILLHFVFHICQQIIDILIVCVKCSSVNPRLFAQLFNRDALYGLYAQKPCKSPAYQHLCHPYPVIIPRRFQSPASFQHFKRILSNKPSKQLFLTVVIAHAVHYNTYIEFIQRIVHYFSNSTDGAVTIHSYRKLPAYDGAGYKQ